MGNVQSKSDGIIIQAINRLSSAIISFSEKIEKIPGKAPEIITVSLYGILHFIISLFHEPWFDEALAWLIARDSSIYQLLFETPHYEGHPALWHLVLMPFAKAGAPYGFTFSLVNFLFAGFAVYLLVFKAPFKRIFRISVPFTYFLFYQFGIISRPYCMMMLAFVLMAITYGKRNEKPGRYVLSLAFLCATSAYGIVYAGGLAIVWLIELWCDETKRINQKSGSAFATKVKSFINNLIENQKIIFLLILLIYALFIIWRIIPAEDAYAAIRAKNPEQQNGLLTRIIYTFFTSVSDLFLTDVYCSAGTLMDTSFSTLEFVCGTVIGILIVGVIVLYGRKSKKLLTWVLPYSMFAVFSSIVYLYRHHIGIELLFIIFWLWICESEKKNAKLANNSEPEAEKHINPAKGGSCNDIILIGKSVGVIMLTIAMIIPMMWTVTSSVCDIMFTYAYGKHEYEYLEDNDLLSYDILCEWNAQHIEENDEYAPVDVTFSLQEVSISPYLEENHILNRASIPELNYSTIHKVPQLEVAQQNETAIKNAGYPEVLLGLPDMGNIYGYTDLNLNDYVKVYQDVIGNIWKGVPGSNLSYIYVRRNLAEEKKLDEVQ